MYFQHNGNAQTLGTNRDVVQCCGAKLNLN